MRRLEAHEFPLHEIFSSDYVFRIPTYQRPYAWRTDQAEQLLEDLVGTLDREDDEPYFLGSIVLVKAADDPVADVIDGQQRLTTLTILLAVLRDLSPDVGFRQELDERVREPGSKLLGLDPKPRLALRERDRVFFAKQVQEAGATDTLGELIPGALTTDAQHAIRENALALRARLADWPTPKQIELAQMLAKRTFLVVVSTPDLASAHRIFSVMNARGLDLSPADIFKSQVVGRVGEIDAARELSYAEKWEEAEELLGRDDFADLFLHIRMIFAKERGRKELLKEFDEQVLSRFLPDRPQSFVDDVVVPYADAYERLRDRAFVAESFAEEVNLWLTRLGQIDNNDWRPPALWALHHKSNDPAWLSSFFRTLERLAASMLIRRVYATPRATRYAGVLRALEAGESLDGPTFTLTPEEQNETLERLRGPLYLVKPVRKYVLLRLDELLANSPGVSYDHRVITIEHVLPQTPRDTSQWIKEFTSDDRTYWTHRLGNLVLLNRSRNSAAQNYDFDQKKTEYFTSGNGVAAFALTTQVLTEQTWTPEVVRARQESAVQLLAQEWGLDG